MEYTVKLTYFKESGKYYSSGEFKSQCEHIFQIVDEAKALHEARLLPGLVEGCTRFTTLVEVVDHPKAFPCLIPGVF